MSRVQQGSAHACLLLACSRGRGNDAAGDAATAHTVALPMGLCLHCHHLLPPVLTHRHSTPLWVQADEEMLLLEAVELYGMGNWPKVAGEALGGGCSRQRGGVWVSAG